MFHDIDNVYNDIKSDEEETKEVKRKKMCKNEIKILPLKYANEKERLETV